MMITCPKCNKTYEESERWPTCPHPHVSLPNPAPQEETNHEETTTQATPTEVPSEEKPTSRKWFGSKSSAHPVPAKHPPKDDHRGRSVRK